MQRVICVVIVLTTPLLLAADTDDDVRKELEALQGKWKMVAGEVAGKPFPKDEIPAFTFIIGAEGKSTGQTPQGDMQVTITINPKNNPKTIENLHESGEQKGKRQYGIYRLERDKYRTEKGDILEWHQVKLQVLAPPRVFAARRGAVS